MSRIIYREPGIEIYESGTVLLMRCPVCKRENYAINVATGVCTWCGYDAREKYSQLHNEKKK